MNNERLMHEINIKENYVDLFIFLNNKEKLNDFVNHLAMFLVQRNRKTEIENPDNFIPCFIHNEKGKTVEFEYNLLVLALEDWIKTKGYHEPKDVIDKFKFNIKWGLGHPSNASIFLVSNLFGMHHKISRTGISTKFGVATQSQIFCIPMVFENKKNNVKFQYNSVSFYLTKIDKIIEKNEYKKAFNDYLEKSLDFKQVAYGSKNVQTFWEENSDEKMLYIEEID